MLAVGTRLSFQRHGGMAETWRRPLVIAVCLIAGELTVHWLEFVLGLLLPLETHVPVRSLSAVLIGTIWVLGWWHLRRVKSDLAPTFDNRSLQMLLWIVSAQALVAVYKVVYVVDREAGLEIVPWIPMLGWGLWGLGALGIAVAILVLVRANRMFDGGLVTTGGITVMVVTGALAIIGGLLGRVHEFSPSTSLQQELIDLGLRLSFLATGIVFRLGMLVVLIGAWRRLNGLLVKQQRAASA